MPLQTRWVRDRSAVGRSMRYYSIGPHPADKPILTAHRVPFSASLQGEDCPGFREKIKAGESATTGLSVKDFRVLVQRAPNVYHSYRRPDGKLVIVMLQESDVPYIPETLPSITDLIAQVDQAISSKFYGVYQTGPNTDLGVLAVELSETIQLLYRPWKKLTGLVKNRFLQSDQIAERILRSPALRRLPRQRRFRYAAEKWRERYLEVYFGWLPFQSEVYGIYQDLNDLLTAPRLIQVNLGASADKIESLFTRTSFVTISGSHTRTTRIVRSARVRGAYRSVVSLDTELNPLPANPSDIYPALWEAIPYSWLTDYVFNVGHVLAAEQSAQALNWAWLSRTDRTVYSHSIRSSFACKTPVDCQVVGLETKPGRLVAEHKHVFRRSLNSIVPPSLGLRHKPQTAVAALAAVAAITDQAAQNFARKRRWNHILNSL